MVILVFLFEMKNKLNEKKIDKNIRKRSGHMLFFVLLYAMFLFALKLLFQIFMRKKK